MTGAGWRSALAERKFLLEHLHAIRGLQRRLKGRAVRSGEGAGTGTPVRVVALPGIPESDAGMSARFWQWCPHLESRGIEFRILPPCREEDYANFWTEDPGRFRRFLREAVRTLGSNLEEAAAADAIVLHRALLPFSPWQRPGLEVLLSRANPRIVFDMFDSIWEKRRQLHDASRSPLARWLNPRDTVETILRHCMAVTVTSETLATFARDHNGSVTILPMLVEPERIPPKVHRGGSETVLAWMGNPGNLNRLESLVPALRKVATRTPIRLRVVSGRTFRAEGVPVESLTHPWSPGSEAEDLLAADVGLLPMFDDPVDRGKFPFKLLQYSAAELPTVASPVAIDRSVFRDGESIVFARGEDDWVEAVVRLAQNPGLRNAIGRSARRVVTENYSYAAHADRFAGLLRAVAAGPTAHRVEPGTGRGDRQRGAPAR